MVVVQGWLGQGLVGYSSGGVWSGRVKGGCSIGVVGVQGLLGHKVGGGGSGVVGSRVVVKGCWGLGWWRV